MHAPPLAKTGVYAISRAQLGVYSVRTLSSWLVEWLLAGRLLKRFFVCPRPTLGHLIRGTLHLSVLQELVHQGRLLSKALVNFMTCRDKCCSPFRLEKLGRNVPPSAVEEW